MAPIYKYLHIQLLHNQSKRYAKENGSITNKFALPNKKKLVKYVSILSIVPIFNLKFKSFFIGHFSQIPFTIQKNTAVKSITTGPSEYNFKYILNSSLFRN